MLRVANLSAPLDADQHALEELALHRLHARRADLISLTLRKKSVAGD